MSDRLDIEKLAEAVWRQESKRATGRDRLVPYSEAPPVEHIANWARASAVLAAIRDQGFAIVPREPTTGNLADAWATFEEAMKDPEYAWGWHCNLAMPIMDAIGVSHKDANTAAAHLMQFLWDCDITTHPNFVGKKSDAQIYHVLRMAAEDVPPTSAESEQ